MKKDKIVKMFGRYLEGVSLLNENEQCTLIADGETLKIEAQSGSFNIALDRITNLNFMTKDEMVAKNKSVVGRSLVGGVVGLGALGAISGIGQKMVKETNYFVVINYKAKDTEEIKTILFGVDKYDSINSHFLAVVSKRINTEKLDIEL